MAALTIPINDWANRIFAWCLSLTALVLSCLAASSCRFVRVTAFDSGADSYSVSLGGLYQFYDRGAGGCVSYSLPLDAADPTDPDRITISGSHRAAKAFAVIAAFLAGTAMFILLVPLLRTLSGGVWRAAGGLLAASAVFQALTFLIFNDDECKTREAFPAGGGSVRCSVDEGGNFAIAAIVVGLLGTAVVCRTPPPREEPLLSFEGGGGGSDKDGGGGTATSVPDEFANEQQQEAHPHPATAAGMPGVAPHGVPSHPPADGAAQFRAPSQQQQAATGAHRTVTETVNADGSKTVYITTTMDGGGGGASAAQRASSAASSSHADYAHGVRHSRASSGGGGDLGVVGEV